MKTDDAARRLNCTSGHVRHLLRKKILKGTKVGPRRWEADRESVEAYRLVVESPKSERPSGTAGGLLTEETQRPDKETSPESTAGRTSESDSEAANLIPELEADVIVVADKRVNMAQLFWALSRFFLDGLERGSIFPTVMEFLPEGSADERAAAANEAVRKLMFALRTLELVHDENRQYGRRGQTVVACTTLGARVIRALRSKGWPRT
jgi:excisionase family DNA binding protein